MMKVDFNKYENGLVPAIIQDAETSKVLMLGYMNEEAFEHTRKEQLVTFYSRSKKRLWTKGEESGNYLKLVSMESDCDQDALLVKALPGGPVCHTGSDTCWNETNSVQYGFLSQLESIIDKRSEDLHNAESYVALLLAKGINSIAQKVGEEAVETVIASKDDDQNAFLNESADLLFHLMVLIKAKHFKLNDVVDVLRSRH